MEFIAATPTQLGRILQGYRKQRRLTQRDLGARVGLTQKAISILESDPSRSSVERLFKVLSALEVHTVLRDRGPKSQQATSSQNSEPEW